MLVYSTLIYLLQLSSLDGIEIVKQLHNTQLERFWMN